MTKTKSWSKMVSSSIPGSFDPEILLKHNRWLRALACSLVGDDDRAEDVVQQTWMAYALSPPKNPGALVHWLRMVVKNLSNKSHRQEYRRRDRELRYWVQKNSRGMESPAAEELVLRAETQKRVVEAVLSLVEPYRSTVLQYYLEEQSAQEIAKQQAVPVATVWTRLRRAVEQLRQLLDEEYGSRSSWCLVLTPAVQWSSPVAALPAAAGSLRESTQSTSFGALGTWVTILPALILGTVIGVVLASDLFQNDAGRPENLSTIPVVTVIEKRHNILRVEAEKLAAKVQLQQQRLQELKLELAKTARLKPRQSLDFGDPVVAKGLANIDGKELSAAFFALQSAIQVWNRESLALGYESVELSTELQKQNLKLVGLLLPVILDLPTLSPNNGAYTHPQCIFNLLDIILTTTGRALTAEQQQQLSTLGREFEREFPLLLEQEEGELVPRMEGFLAEIELKQRLFGSMRELLDGDQYELLFGQALVTSVGLDLLSSGASLGACVETLKIKVETEDRQELIAKVSLEYAIDLAAQPSLNAILEEYAQSLPVIEKARQSMTPRLEQCLPSAYILLALQKELLAEPRLSNLTRSIIRADQSWFVLIKDSE